ncbi:cytochrome b [Pleomorphomonas sp. NRK KF1]|uniref:cytochrome b n=1 Tax=Pleomorphomonas sp. NRK KF1 TaxID=2943000 RepID=UPI0020448355|nr:cytochrome b [Pleomorphomonas sp. NRK KF1]MCM5554359.1 cytochrome b [Pleomorphomonas sp. NRK KF1]
MKDQSTLFDHPEGYGTISRALHWLMAALFAWQFLSAILHAVDREMPAARFFWSWHMSVGFLLLIAVVLRGAWALVNLGNRPVHAAGLLGIAARLGHLALYLLMLAVPAVAVLRAYGSGRGLSVFGIEVFAGGGERIPELMAPANAMHGLLGWALLALTLGHIGMALAHAYLWRQDTLTRMVRGRPTPIIGTE